LATETTQSTAQSAHVKPKGGGVDAPAGTANFSPGWYTALSSLCAAGCTRLYPPPCANGNGRLGCSVEGGHRTYSGWSGSRVRTAKSWRLLIYADVSLLLCRGGQDKGPTTPHTRASLSLFLSTHGGHRESLAPSFTRVSVSLFPLTGPRAKALPIFVTQRRLCLSYLLSHGGQARAKAWLVLIHAYASLFFVPGARAKAWRLLIHAGASISLLTRSGALIATPQFSDWTKRLGAK
jgi:hypothetical protein